jgi:hypothetical protein
MTDCVTVPLLRKDSLAHPGSSTRPIEVWYLHKGHCTTKAPKPLVSQRCLWKVNGFDNIPTLSAKPL